MTLGPVGRRRSPLAAAICAAVISLSACAIDPAAAKQTRVETGDRYYREHRYQDAVREYRKAVELDRRSGDLRLKLASAFQALGDPRNALFEFTRASDLLPDSVETQLQAGEMMLAAGQFTEARTRAIRVLRKHPRNVPAQILLAHAVAGLDNLGRVLTKIENAVRIEADRTTTYQSLADVQYIRGDRRTAEAAFRRAVTLDADSVDAHLSLANYYWTAEQLDHADEELNRALVLEPQNIVANRAMALFLLARGDVMAAERFLKTVAALTQSASSQLMLADYYLSQSRVEDALAILGPLTSHPDRFIDVTLRIARLELMANRPEKARAAIDAVLSHQPYNGTAMALSARVLFLEGKHDQALQQTEKALMADSTLVDAYLLRGSIYLAKEQPREAAVAFSDALRLNPSSATAKVQLARLQLAAGASDTSAQLAGQAVAAQPADIDARLVFARALIARRDSAGAARELAVLLEKAPRSAPVQVAAGLLAMLDGDAEAARRALRRALDINPQDDDALAALLSLDLAAKQFADARSAIELRVATAPENAKVLTLAARVYAAIGDKQSAEESLRRLIRVDPSSLQAYSMLARMYRLDGRLTAARRELEAFAERQPDSLPALTMLGTVLQLANEEDEAIRVYETALRLDPDAAVPANNLAWLYATTDANLDLALQLAQTAKAQLPDRPEVDDTLGWIYYKKGLSTLAVDAFRESVARQPDNVTYLFHLGLAYAQNNDRFLARQTLERALSLKSDFDGADQARTLLISVSR